MDLTGRLMVGNVSGRAWSNGTDVLGNYIFMIEDNSGTTARLNLTQFDLSTKSLYADGFLDTSFNDIMSFSWTYVNRDTAAFGSPNYNYRDNIVYAVSGSKVDAAGKTSQAVDFIYTDINNTVLSSFSVAVKGTNAPGRVIPSVLQDNSSSVFAFQDGTDLHLVTIDGLGTLQKDTIVAIPANAIFDRIRGLGDGRIELSWREPLAGSENTLKFQIFDTRSAGVTLNGSTFPDMLAGTTFNDTINAGGGNDVISGGAGADSLVGGDGVDTVSYVGSSAGVTVNLGTDAASGGDAAGDTIAGFENILGSGFNDFLIGNDVSNILNGNLIINSF
jgi:Ca2+-binding RTX toxin-like protein